MKTKKAWLALSVILAFLFGTGYALSKYKLVQSSAGLVLEMQADKQSYMPGEMISLRFSIKNGSNVATSVSKQSTVWDGNLKVFIAYETGPFKEYVGPGWGTRDRLPRQLLKLNPAESFETEATVLWNQKIETSHLNEVYAKTLPKQRLNTDYALTESGTYYLKAVLYDSQTGTNIESAPLFLALEEPQGADLNIWKTLKQNADYALFIQTGGLMEHPNGPKTVKVARELENIMSRHSDSRYAKSIRSGLSKHKETVEGLGPDKPLEN